ncbi:MAG TPA: hypothetical protein VFW25_02575 [Silvibacterium sp.]|nr:hypothetical protein [Silvibacterium sp.]
MTLIPRCVIAFLMAGTFGITTLGYGLQQTGDPANPAAEGSSSTAPGVDRPPAPPVVRGGSRVADINGGSWLFRHYSIGSFGSPLGFGGRLAVSLTSSLNMRVGASYFSYSRNSSESGIPYDANVRLQSEQAVVDWYPFHGAFHISPGAIFGDSNRAFGAATVTAGNSFTLNGTTYFSGSSRPVQASGSVRFPRTAALLTLGRGNWIRHPEERGGSRHWAFPFEAGVAFMGNPKTALNYSGVVCTNPSQLFCQDISTDATVQANIQAERKKLQNDANWLRYYPVISGGVIYRF